jgi:hypothetical protein
MFTYYLRVKYYYHAKEWAYKNIIPKIICEKYLMENGRSPMDYKFFCFNGKPRFIQVDIDRFEHHKRNLYDTNWKLLDLELGHPKLSKKIDKPLALKKMIQYASELSQSLPFVRVDLYNFEGRIIFGEMTFYPLSGAAKFNPIYYDKIFGDYIKLPRY